MAKPQFREIEPDLFTWKDWVIARMWEQWFLLTCATREFGPYGSFDEAYDMAEHLS